MLDTNNNNDIFFEKDKSSDQAHTDSDAKAKPHIIRRNIEDYLEKRELEKRLKDVFDDDFLLD